MKVSMKENIKVDVNTSSPWPIRITDGSEELRITYEGALDLVGQLEQAVEDYGDFLFKTREVEAATDIEREILYVYKHISDVPYISFKRAIEHLQACTQDGFNDWWYKDKTTV